MVTHFREYFLFGLFFAIVTPLQIAWSVLIIRRPDDRRLLIAGGAVNHGIALIWLVYPTVGLTFGPEQFQAETIAVKDLLATWDELLIGIIVAMLVLRSVPRPAPRWLPGLAWGLAAVSLVAALIAKGGH